MTNGQSYEYTAKTVEAAVDEGLRELDVSRDQIDIEVINEGSRGILGIGATEAQVRLTRKAASGEAEAPPQEDSAAAAEAQVDDEAEPEESADIDDSSGSPESAPPADDGTSTVQATESEVETGEDEDEDDAELEDIAFDLLNQMLLHLDIEAEIELSWLNDPEEKDSALNLNIIGDDLGFLIGRNGETLASMQYLIRLMVNQELHRWKNIVIDVDGYKQRRAEKLSQLAHRLADQVIASGRPASLEPMPASERRLVHIALRNHEQVYTASTGEDSRRKVQILLK